MKFPTYIKQRGDKVLHRYIEDGVRHIRTHENLNPTLFLKSDKPTGFKSLLNEYVKPISFNTVNEAREAVKRYSTITNSKLFGTVDWGLQWTNETYPDELKYDLSQVLVFKVDIETRSGKQSINPQYIDTEVLIRKK